MAVIFFVVPFVVTEYDVLLSETASGSAPAVAAFMIKVPGLPLTLIAFMSVTWYNTVWLAVLAACAMPHNPNSSAIIMMSADNFLVLIISYLSPFLFFEIIKFVFVVLPPFAVKRFTFPPP